MEMVIRGKVQRVISVYIEYDFDGKDCYYVIAECNAGMGALKRELVKVTSNPKEAIEIRNDIDAAINAAIEKTFVEVDS